MSRLNRWNNQSILAVRLLLLWLWLWTEVPTLSSHPWTCLASSDIDGRYSFSLTTFDPSGKLGQVERAALAASLGTPIIAICKPGRVVLAAPQVLPSVLLKDDGTSRFVYVAPQILMAHSGISADGRVLVAAAQRLAIEHAYTFDEPIPISILLEQMSLLYQEYTMKPGARPFGVTLLVAHVPAAPSINHTKIDRTNECSMVLPNLYRIDPSGAVTSLGSSYAVVNGNFLPSMNMEGQLQTLATTMTATSSSSSSSSIEEDRANLTQILQRALDDQANSRENRFAVDTPNRRTSYTILTASLTERGDMVIERTERDD